MNNFTTRPMQTAAVALGDGTAIDLTDAGGSYATLGIQITGINGDTITFEATIDGTNWVSILATPLLTGTAAVTATANGIYRIDCAGLLKVCARISTYGTGTVTVWGLASA